MHRKFESISVGMFRSFRGNHTLESSPCVLTSPGCSEFNRFPRFSGRIWAAAATILFWILSTFHRIPTRTYQECCEFVTKLCGMFSGSSESLRALVCGAFRQLFSNYQDLWKQFGDERGAFRGLFSNYQDPSVGIIGNLFGRRSSHCGLAA